jgi:hypothetical protein
VKKRPAFELSALALMLLRRTFGTHADLHAHAFMRYPLSFKCAFESGCEVLRSGYLQCSEYSREGLTQTLVHASFHTQTHTHAPSALTLALTRTLAFTLKLTLTLAFVHSCSFGAPSALTLALTRTLAYTLKLTLTLAFTRTLAFVAG